MTRSRNGYWRRHIDRLDGDPIEGAQIFAPIGGAIGAIGLALRWSIRGMAK